MRSLESFINCLSSKRITPFLSAPPSKWAKYKNSTFIVCNRKLNARRSFGVHLVNIGKGNTCTYFGKTVPLNEKYAAHLDIIALLTHPLVLAVVAFDTLLLVLGLFVFTIRKINALSKSIPGNANLLSEQIKAHQQAMEIITQANEQAQKMINDTQEIKEVLHKRLFENFEQVLAHSKVLTQEQMTLFNNHLEQLMVKTQQEHVAQLDKTLHELTLYLKSQSDGVIKQMETNVTNFSREDRTYMEDEIKKIKADLEQYKQEEVNKITNNIYEILARTSERVLGQAVDLDLHQELIIKALEQAKRDGVFI